MIGIGTGLRHPCPASVTGAGYTLVHRDSVRTGTERILGSIFYTHTSLPGTGAFTVFHNNKGNNNDYRDLLIHTRGLNSTPTVLGCDSSDSGLTPCSGTQTMDRLTSIRGSTSSTHAGGWTVTNFVEATSVGATSFDYQGASGTARLCKRYENGALTNEPLWPWPMGQRIKAALAAAGTTALAGSAQTVTSEIESIFGTIPTVCRKP